MNQDSNNIEMNQDNNFLDDDLTNLSWLQDADLLRNISRSQNARHQLDQQTHHQQHRNNISHNTAKSQLRNFRELTNHVMNSYKIRQQQKRNNYMPSGIHLEKKRKNLKDDYDDDVTMNKKMMSENKPPFSFTIIIFMAIESSVHKKLPVKKIYDWVLDNFPYFRKVRSGWKNSIRHNLSLNRCFKKIGIEGKKSQWCVDERCHSELVRTVSSLSFHPHINSSSYINSWGKVQLKTNFCDVINDNHRRSKRECHEEGVDDDYVHVYNGTDTQDGQMRQISNKVEYDAATTLVQLSKMAKEEDDVDDGGGGGDGVGNETNFSGSFTSFEDRGKNITSNKTKNNCRQKICLKSKSKMVLRKMVDANDETMMMMTKKNYDSGNDDDDDEKVMMMMMDGVDGLLGLSEEVLIKTS